MSAVAKAFVVDVKAEQVHHLNGSGYLRLLLRGEELIALHKALDELVRGAE